MGLDADSRGLADVVRGRPPLSDAEFTSKHPTLLPPVRDLAPYSAAMRRDGIPKVSDPEAELLWIAFNLSEQLDAEGWASGPSLAAIRWLRELRLKKSLRAKFWGETWAGYMNRRLSITLPGTTVVPADASKRAKAKNRDLAGLVKAEKAGDGRISAE